MPSPHAVPVTRKTLGLASRTPALSSSAGSGGATLGYRPEDRRERVDARDRVEQSRRRHARVELAEDPRALDLLAKLRLAGHVERDGARDPDDRRAGGSAEHEPASESSTRSGGTHEEARPDRARRPSPPTLWRRKPSATAPPSATSGVYGDSLPERNCGASLAPKYAPATIPASEKAPPTSPRRSPFSAASAITAAAIQSTVVTSATLLSGPATLSVALGGVVQLVRTPACHAGGRGFG